MLEECEAQAGYMQGAAKAGTRNRRPRSGSAMQRDAADSLHRKQYSALLVKGYLKQDSLNE